MFLFEAAESGKQAGSEHGQEGIMWQQRSLQTATRHGETAADSGKLQGKGRRFV